MTTTPRHSVAVAGVTVREDGRILVVQRRDNGRWEAPGGVLEQDETFEHGVHREIAEETGVTVAVESLSGVYKNMKIGVVALVTGVDRSPERQRRQKSLSASSGSPSMRSSNE